MRKYVQVVLVVLSVFSLVSLLVYRHEYNKLRYVLEVLNFFGTPGGTPPNGTCLNNMTYRHYALTQPPPAWQRVSNTIYVYSAYWDTLDEHNVVKAVAIGVLNENLNYGCYMWFDNQETPVQGEFSFSGIPRKNQKTPSKNSISAKYFAKTTKNKGYIFYCKAREASGTPFGVTFYKTNNDETAQAYVPVALINRSKAVHNSTAVCVMPREAPFGRKTEYLEFLSYHNVIGVQDFFVYGGEFVYNILALMHRDPRISINVDSLQWNYPFVTDYDLMRSVAEADCLLRTKGFFESAIALAWNQFLVPKFHSSISNIIQDFDPDRKVPKFQIPTVLFCLEYNDDPKATVQLPLIFRKSRYALPRSNITVMINRLLTEGNKVQKISREIAAVHWYTKCDMFDLKVVDKTEPKYDHSILRFNSELLQSNIFRVRNLLL